MAFAVPLVWCDFERIDYCQNKCETCGAAKELKAGDELPLRHRRGTESTRATS